MVAHYLGVDHAGHKFGPRHPEMARKLGEADRAVRRLAMELPADCLLLVAGDHGMTSSGDHGGDSQDEVRAALVAHSKRFRFRAARGDQPVAQVDLATTLALLLGVPIPYSSLGRLIPDLFTDLRGARPDIESLLEANVDQVANYLDEYARQGGRLPEETKARVAKEVADFRATPRGSRGRFDSGMALLALVRRSCAAVWAQFDTRLMAAGATAAMLLLATASALVLTPRARLLTGVVSADLLGWLAAAAALGAVSAAALAPANANTCELAAGAAVFSSTMVFGFVLFWKLSLSAGAIISSISLTDGKTSVNVAIAAAVFLFSFSNSFVVEEAAVLNFCCVSFLLGYLWLLRRPAEPDDETASSSTSSSFRRQTPLSIKLRTSPSPSRSARMAFVVLSLCGLVRLSNVYFRCREEQSPHCLPTEHHKPLGTLPSTPEYASYRHYRFGSTVVSAAAGVVAVTLWLRRCGNLNALSPAVTAATYVPTVSALCTVFYWALQV